MCATRPISGLPAPKTAHVVADVDARADARDGPRRAFPVDGARERGAMSFRPGSKASERKKGFKKAIDADEARRKREGACDAIDARESIDANDDVVARARARARFVRGARRQRAREGDERGAQVEGDLAAARSRMTTDARVTRGIVRGGR
tara:strand:+ start:163 stop:612 length:450 start_codon:yes stop_codon:yes gene_type:complete